MIFAYFIYCAWDHERLNTYILLSSRLNIAKLNLVAPNEYKYKDLFYLFITRSCGEKAILSVELCARK